MGRCDEYLVDNKYKLLRMRKMQSVVLCKSFINRVWDISFQKKDNSSTADMNSTAIRIFFICSIIFLLFSIPVILIAHEQIRTALKSILPS